jgi:hypothetical protein
LYDGQLSNDWNSPTSLGFLQGLRFCESVYWNFKWSAAGMLGSYCNNTSHEEVKKGKSATISFERCKECKNQICCLCREYNLSRLLEKLDPADSNPQRIKCNFCDKRTAGYYTGKLL